jgi:hypothetical protein
MANREVTCLRLLAGDFREYPFSLLLEIFLLRRETGLLEVSSSEESGYFYFKNGKVKDGRIGKSKGIAAINVVRKFNDGSFRFKQLEPAEYARVVWQRRFGPTAPAPAIVELPIPFAAIRNQIGQLFAPATARRVLTDVGALTHQTLFQIRLYASATYQGFQEIEMSIRRRTVAYAAAAYVLWRRAILEIQVRRILKKASSRPRDRKPELKYPRKISFQLPSVTRTAAIASALQQGVEHNVIFAFTVTILLGVSGVMVYQLVFGNKDSTEAGFTIDQHFDISPAKPTPPTTKPKRERRKRRSTNSSRGKSPNKKSVLPSAQDPGVVPETTPPTIAPVS